MNPFTTAFIKAPKRSRFDFNHSNTFGMRFGCLTPTLSQFIIPGDEVSLSMEQICRLAPMPVPTFVNLKVRHDFFFVPLRLLYGQEYLDKLFGADTTVPRASVDNLESLVNIVNYFSLSRDANGLRTHNIPSIPGAPFVAGSLSDFLKYPVFTDRNGALISTDLTQLNGNLPSWGSTFDASNGSNVPKVNVLANTPPLNIEPYFAYHFIWRDWYRFTGIQDNSINETFLSNGVLSQWYSSSPIVSFSSNNSTNAYSAMSLTAMFGGIGSYINGSSVFHFGDLGKFQYAHYKKDMFTSVRYGSKPTVLIPTGTNGTIPALREASAIQRFLDIISITGQRYFDKVKGLFGVEPVGPKDDRVEFLARYQQFIKVGEVLTTATTSEAETGDYAGRGILVDGKYLFKRRFTEHGWLMCITSVVPDVAYTGLSRELTDVYPLDTPLPSLAEVGDQTVFNREVNFSYGYNSANNASFGDQFRYYAYKSAPSEVHGFFAMTTGSEWAPTLNYSVTDPIQDTKVLPIYWNRLFNDTADEYLFGDRFFFNIDFYESITRALPKYINYHL